MSRGVGCVLLSLATAVGCTNAPSYVFVHNPVVSVKITPPDDTIPFAGSGSLHATPLDINGQPTIPDHQPVWSSLSPSIISVDTGGNVRAIWYGPGTIRVQIDGVEAQATVFISDPPIDSIQLTPADRVIERGDTITFHARAFNAARLPVVVGIVWSVSDTMVAHIDSTGHLLGVGAGPITVSARADSFTQTTPLSVVLPAATFRVTPASHVLPYDQPVSLGVVPVDSAGRPLADRPIALTLLSPAGALFVQSQLPTGDTVAAIRAFASGTALIEIRALHLVDTFSVSVPGLQFRSVIPGPEASCAIATDSTAYCWGAGWPGQFGNGDLLDTGATPRRVSGGLHFASLVAGFESFCGLTATGSAYCWGDNSTSELGAPGVGAYDSVPAPVAGGLHFSSLSAAYPSVCGLAGGLAYCWGGAWGATPTAVPGSLTFTRVFLGLGYYSRDSECGSLASDGTTYCWSPGNTPTQYFTLTVDSAGSGNPTNVCWLSSGSAFCGSPYPGATLQNVFPSTQFRTVARTADVTCGIDVNGGTYCAGNNGYGELGTGNTTSSDTLVAVLTPVPLTDLRAGWYHLCGMGTDGRAYCWGLNPYGITGVGGSQPFVTTPQLVLNQQ